MKRTFATGLIFFTVIFAGCGFTETGSEVKDDKEDEIFKDELDPYNRDGNAIAQVILGFTELSLSHYLWPDEAQPRDPRAVALKSAEDDLRRAMATLSVDEKQKVMGQVKETMDVLGKDSDQYETLADELAELSKKPAIESAEKAKAIAAAQDQVASARESLLVQNMKAKTKGGRAVRLVRRAGSLLLVTDILGRVYVWAALGKNPTFSPVLSVVTHYGKEIPYADILAAVKGSSESNRNKDDYINEFEN